MNRPNDIPTQPENLDMIVAEARRLRARFVADAVARLVARLRGAAPAHTAEA